MAFSGMVLIVSGATSASRYRVSWAAGSLVPVQAHSRRCGLAGVGECLTTRRSQKFTIGFVGAPVNGNACGKHRVARLMRQHGIVSRHRRKFKVTTNSAHSYPVAENLLRRRFDVSEPGHCWVSDITYIPTWEGWLYLAVTLDLFHTKVVGWAMDRWITRQLIIDALNMAIKSGDRKPGLIHHSDRGVQYASHEFQALLKTHSIQCSMSRKGDCWDNAVAESFFHTLKVQLIHGKTYNTARKQKRLFLNISRYFTTGNAVIPTSAIKAR